MGAGDAGGVAGDAGREGGGGVHLASSLTWLLATAGGVGDAGVLLVMLGGKGSSLKVK